MISWCSHHQRVSVKAVGCERIRAGGRIVGLCANGAQDFSKRFVRIGFDGVVELNRDVVCNGVVDAPNRRDNAARAAQSVDGMT